MKTKCIAFFITRHEINFQGQLDSMQQIISQIDGDTGSYNPSFTPLSTWLNRSFECTIVMAALQRHWTEFAQIEMNVSWSLYVQCMHIVQCTYNDQDTLYSVFGICPVFTNLTSRSLRVMTTLQKAINRCYYMSNVHCGTLQLSRRKTFFRWPWHRVCACTRRGWVLEFNFLIQFLSHPKSVASKPFHFLQMTMTGSVHTRRNANDRVIQGDDRVCAHSECFFINITFEFTVEKLVSWSKYYYLFHSAIDWIKLFQIRT